MLTGPPTTGGWQLNLHARGPPRRAHGHDFLLHRAPVVWPQPVQLPLSAAILEDGSVLSSAPANSAPASSLRRILLVVKGFDHTPGDYAMHAAVLSLSNRTRAMDVLLICNSVAVATPLLLASLRRYPGALKYLVHTSLDVGHHCSEFQLLAATAWLWSRYEWVVYCSGPDEYLTPRAMERIHHLIADHRVRQVWADSFESNSLFADRFPSGLSGDKDGGPLVYRHNGRSYIGRYSLDVLLFRTAALLSHAGAPHGSVWWPATAVCTAHRAYHGLPETVLKWLSVSFNLSVNAVGERARWTACKGNACPIGRNSVWHTHNASAVKEWLDMSLR